MKNLLTPDMINSLVHVRAVEQGNRSPYATYPDDAIEFIATRTSVDSNTWKVKWGRYFRSMFGRTHRATVNTEDLYDKFTQVFPDVIVGGRRGRHIQTASRRRRRAVKKTLRNRRRKSYN